MFYIVYVPYLIEHPCILLLIIVSYSSICLILQCPCVLLLIMVFSAPYAQLLGMVISSYGAIANHRNGLFFIFLCIFAFFVFEKIPWIIQYVKTLPNYS